jgi:hypothetical protein
MKRSFEKEILEELLSDSATMVDGVLYRPETILKLGSSRWHDLRALVFSVRANGAFTYWRTPTYRVGKTEQQDSELWEDTVVCTQVKPVEKQITVIEYEAL